MLYAAGDPAGTVMRRVWVKNDVLILTRLILEGFKKFSYLRCFSIRMVRHPVLVIYNTSYPSHVASTYNRAALIGRSIQSVLIRAMRL